MKRRPPQQSIVNSPGAGTASPYAFPSTHAEEHSQNCVLRSSIAPARRRFTFRVTLYARRTEALRRAFVDHRSPRRRHRITFRVTLYARQRVISLVGSSIVDRPGGAVSPSACHSTRSREYSRISVRRSSIALAPAPLHLPRALLRVPKSTLGRASVDYRPLRSIVHRLCSTSPSFDS